MYLLDTTIVSLFDPYRRASAPPELKTWLRDNDAALFISVLSLMEIEAGLLKLLRELKHQRASQIESLRDAIIDSFSDRLLPVSRDAALETARLAATIRPMVIEQTDLIIAATAKVHRFTVLTRNLRHFSPTGVACLDPMLTLPPG